jgi:hypothetical protein
MLSQRKQAADHENQPPVWLFQVKSAFSGQSPIGSFFSVITGHSKAMSALSFV